MIGLADSLLSGSIQIIANALNGGRLIFYGGTRPAKGAPAPPGADLATFVLRNPVGTVNQLMLTFTTPTPTVGDHSGLATWGRFLASDLSFLADLDVPADITVTYGSHGQIDKGGTVAISTLQWGTPGSPTIPVAVTFANPVLADATGSFSLSAPAPIVWSAIGSIQMQQASSLPLQPYVTSQFQCSFAVDDATSAFKTAQLLAGGVSFPGATMDTTSGASVTTYAGIRLMANDGHGHTALSPPFSLTVVSRTVVAGAPVLMAFPNQVTLVQNEVSVLGQFAYSPSGSPLTVTLTQGSFTGTGLSLATNGTLSAASNAPVQFLDGFRVQYSDGTLTTTSPVFSIEVMPAVPTPQWVRGGTGLPSAFYLIKPPSTQPANGSLVLSILPGGGTLGPGTYSYRVAYAGPGDTFASMGAACVAQTITIASGSNNGVRVDFPKASAPITGYLFYGRTAGSEARIDVNDLQYNAFIDDGRPPTTTLPAPNSPVATFRTTAIGLIRQTTIGDVQKNNSRYAIDASGTAAPTGVSMLIDGRWQITDQTPVGQTGGLKLRVTDATNNQFAVSPSFYLRVLDINDTGPRWNAQGILSAYGVKKGDTLIKSAWQGASSPLGWDLTYSIGPNSAYTNATLVSVGITLNSQGHWTIGTNATPGAIYDGITVRADDGHGGISESSPFRIYIMDSRPVWMTMLQTYNLRAGETEYAGVWCGSPNYYPLTFDWATGTAPFGVTLDKSTGAISATVSVATGNYSGFSLTATDSNGDSAVSPLFNLNIQPPTTIQPKAFPVGFNFTVGVPASYDIGSYWAGSPASVTLNKTTVSDEGVLAGITYDPVTRVLSYDGSGGLGSGLNFIWVATDGSLPHHEFIAPYAATRPFQSIPHVNSQNLEPYGTGPSGTAPMDDRPINPRTVAVMMAGLSYAAPQLFWNGRNGDWWDASYPPRRRDDVLNPGAPWATITANADATFTADVSELYRLMQAGEIQNYGLILLPSAGTAVNWRGPAYATTAQRPYLNITFDDGTTAPPILASVASTLSKSTVSANPAPIDFFTHDPTGFLYFDILGITKNISQATISLTAFQRFQTPIVSIYAARWEGQVAGTPVQWGFAENYPPVGGVVESGIESNADIHVVERMPDINFLSRSAWYPSSGALTQPPAIAATLQYIVGDTDPNDAAYQPLKPGIKAVKWMIPAGSTGAHRMMFMPWGLYGSGPSISSSFQDLQEIYVRWYQRWGNDFDFDPTGPNLGGHASGPGGYADGRAINASTGKPEIVPQTGRYVYNPNTIGDVTGDNTWVSVTNFETTKSEHSSPEGTICPLGNYGIRVNEMYTYCPGTATPGSGAGAVNVLNINHRQLMRKNRWHCIDVGLRMNSQYPNAFHVLSNGQEKVWVDGRLSMYRPDVCASLKTYNGITYVDVQWYYGGTGNSPTQLSIYHSQWIIARRYIGPMAA